MAPRSAVCDGADHQWATPPSNMIRFEALFVGPPRARSLRHNPYVHLHSSLPPLPQPPFPRPDADLPVSSDTLTLEQAASRLSPLLLAAIGEGSTAEEEAPFNASDTVADLAGRDVLIERGVTRACGEGNDGRRKSYICPVMGAAAARQVTSAPDCARLCVHTDRCRSWQFEGRRCVMYSLTMRARARDASISGDVDPPVRVMVDATVSKAGGHVCQCTNRTTPSVHVLSSNAPFEVPPAYNATFQGSSRCLGPRRLASSPSSSLHPREACAKEAREDV